MRDEVPKRSAAKQIRDRHHRFFRELRAISTRKPVSPDISEQLLYRLEDLVQGRGRIFAKATISNSETTIELDETFEENVRRLLMEEDSSYGRVEGTLDAANIHGATPKFWIYPRIGPDRIKCDFLPGTAEQIREALGQYVQVEGVKFFRPQSPYPYRVAVREFEIQARNTADALLNLRGIAPQATGRLTSAEFVRAIRDEWD